MKKTPDRPATGIRRTLKGWQAYVRIDGQLRAKRFPANTMLSTMLDWRKARRPAPF